VKNPIETMEKNSINRTWKWWLNWLFAAYGIAVGLTILSMTILPPIIGWPATDKLMFGGGSMLIFTAIGGVICYKYLK